MRSKFRFLTMIAAAVTVVLAVAPAAAQQTYTVTVTNLTQNQIFSPPLVVSHSGDVALFRAGEPAIPELAELAEDGSPAALVSLLDGAPGVFDISVADGPVMPGASVTVRVTARSPSNLISAVGMLITTNDAFFAVNSARRPLGNRLAVLDAHAYDAGSEANTESCEHIPGPPCGNGGVRVTDGAEGYVYVSPGIQGIGDVAPENDWRNPVARVYIQRAR